MELDDQTGVLVAIGSAAAVNCHDCLRRLEERATALNIGADEMAAAVRIGLRVRHAAGEKAEGFASSAFGPAGERPPADREFAAVAGPAAGVSGNSCCVSDERAGRR